MVYYRDVPPLTERLKQDHKTPEKSHFFWCFITDSEKGQERFFTERIIQ